MTTRMELRMGVRRRLGDTGVDPISIKSSEYPMTAGVYGDRSDRTTCRSRRCRPPNSHPAAECQRSTGRIRHRLTHSSP